MTQSVMSNVAATEAWRAESDPQCQRGIRVQRCAPSSSTKEVKTRRSFEFAGHLD